MSPLQELTIPFPASEILAEAGRLTELEKRNFAEARLSKEQQARLSELLRFNRARSLTESETAELETLLDQMTEIALYSLAAQHQARRTDNAS